MFIKENDLIGLDKHCANILQTRSVNEMCLDPAWEKVCGHYKLVSYLGEGSYGQVIMGVCRRTDTPVAIKLM